MKRVAILATTGAVLISAGLLIPKVAYADEDFVRGILVERLSEKLGLTESEVEDVMIEIRSEEREERDAERDLIVSNAIESGTLTERQVEIMDALKENRPEPGDGRKGSGDGDCTEMVDVLNEQGLNVTQDELTELKTVREDLGLVGGPRGGQDRFRGN